LKKPMPRETYVPCLLDLFRQYGYDGATLAKIAQATGLGKASLYHHFPGGKDEMVEAVLDFAEGWLNRHILQPLAGPGDVHDRLQRMCQQFSEYYEGGKQPCLLPILLLSSTRDVFHERVKTLFRIWIDAIAAVLIESGLEQELAYQRAEDMAIAIQGSLILSQGLNDPAPFQRVIQELPAKLYSARGSA
jgi:TetR/AcrR family transcriptional regulator, lmrAB and yxaGH operons repressor